MSKSIIEQKVSEDEREHSGLPEKVLRNKVIVALYLCGFSQRQISRITGSHKRNIQHFLAKYTSRYQKEILDNIKNFDELTKKKTIRRT